MQFKNENKCIVTVICTKKFLVRIDHNRVFIY